MVETKIIIIVFPRNGSETTLPADSAPTLPVLHWLQRFPLPKQTVLFFKRQSPPEAIIRFVRKMSKLLKCWREENFGRKISSRRTLGWRFASVDRAIGYHGQSKNSRFSPNFSGCEPAGRERGVIDSVSCILYIGLLVLCIALSRFIWACASYVDRAKSAGDINLGLQVPTAHGLFNLGISGKNRPNAKDHPASSKSDGHKH